MKSLCLDGFDIRIPDVMEEILLFRVLGYFLQLREEWKGRPEGRIWEKENMYV